MISNNKKISIFLPVYNEYQRIIPNIEGIMTECKKNKLSFEIIVIDDNSNDDSLTKIKKACNKHKEISYYHYLNGPTFRENLAQTFKKAKGEIIIFADIDLAKTYEHINLLVNEINKGFDIVVGSRYKNTKTKRSIKRLIISKIFNKLIQIMFKSKILDHQCGAKAFKKELILSLVKEMGYDKKNKRKWFWDTEILLRAQKKDLKIKEIGIKWAETKESSVKMRQQISIIKYIMNLKNRM
ncbi:MAG: glycosyltransferase [Nanoarchaeota archaeon]